MATKTKTATVTEETKTPVTEEVKPTLLAAEGDDTTTETETKPVETPTEDTTTETETKPVETPVEEPKVEETPTGEVTHDDAGDPAPATSADVGIGIPSQQYLAAAAAALNARRLREQYAYWQMQNRR